MVTELPSVSMGKGGHSDDEATPFDQSMEEMDFTRSACSAAQNGQVQCRKHLTTVGIAV